MLYLLIITIHKTHLPIYLYTLTIQGKGTYIMRCTFALSF